MGELGITRGGDLWFTRAAPSDLLFTGGRDGFGGLDRRLFFAKGHAEVTVFDGLHPGMPEKAIAVRAVALFGTLDVGHGNEAMSGKLLHELDHIPARDMELRCKMVERRPCVALATREVSQIGVELFCLLRKLWAFLKPLRQPHAMEEAVRIDKFAARNDRG